jgi:hypothetical protein
VTGSSFTVKGSGTFDGNLDFYETTPSKEQLAMVLQELAMETADK